MPVTLPISTLGEMNLDSFNRARKDGPVVATVLGQVTQGIRHTDGDALTIVDSSGTVDLWVPRTVPKDDVGIDKWFEFDLVAEQVSDEVIDLAARQEAVTRAALSGDPEEAGAVALEFIIAIQGSTRPVVANAQRSAETPSDE